MEDLEEFNGTNLLKSNNELFSRNKTNSFNNNISELNSRQILGPKPHFYKDSIEQFIFEIAPIDKTLFFQSQSIMKVLQTLSLKHYIPEINKFIDVMMDNSIAFDEKLKYLWFMKVLHYKIVNYHQKFVSKYLPCCIYVLNEFYNPFEKIIDQELGCDQSEYIPSILVNFFEKLLNENQDNSTTNMKDLNSDKKITKVDKNTYNFEKTSNANNSIEPINNNILIPPPPITILKNNIEEKGNFHSYDKILVSNIKRYEKTLIIQELSRIFTELSYKKSKSTLKSIIRTPWITRLNSYEAIQSLLYLLYYKSPSVKIRESSVPPKKTNQFFQKKNTKIEYFDDSKSFIKTLEEETPIKKSNISSIKSRYKENMLMKNPFLGQKVNQFKNVISNNNNMTIKVKINDDGKNVENVNDEEANDVMELHLEKYFPSKSFSTPFKEDENGKKVIKQTNSKKKI